MSISTTACLVKCLPVLGLLHACHCHSSFHRSLHSLSTLHSLTRRLLCGLEKDFSYQQYIFNYHSVNSNTFIRAIIGCSQYSREGKVTVPCKRRTSTERPLLSYKHTMNTYTRTALLAAAAAASTLLLAQHANAQSTTCNGYAELVSLSSLTVAGGLEWHCFQPRRMSRTARAVNKTIE